MPEFSGKIHAPVLALLAKELLSLVKNDYELRQIQGANAQQACYFDQPSGGVATGTIYTLTEPNSDEVFTSLVITFDTTSGSGRYRVDGVNPSLTQGHQIPAGGGILTITGHNNIKRFAMTPEAAQTLLFARNLYK